MGAIKDAKICEKLTVSVGSLLGEHSPATANDFHDSGEGEFNMIYKQLKAILENADDNVIEQIIGKIGMEHMKLMQKQDSSRNRAANGE